MNTIKIEIVDAVLIDGRHREVGTTLDVEAGLARRLVAANKARPALAAVNSELPLPQGKQTKALGLSTADAAAMVKRHAR